MFKGFIQKSFIAGLAVITPIAATAWLVLGVDKLFFNLIPPDLVPKIPGVGIIFALIFILVIGFIARNYLGKFLFRTVETVINSIPVVSKVYVAVKQVLETLIHSKKGQFRSVVLVEFPRKGLWALAFITSNVPKMIENSKPLKNKDPIFIFVPTAPNPTSGFLVAIEKTETHHVDLSVEDAFKLILSGGIVHPEHIRKMQKSKKA